MNYNQQVQFYMISGEIPDLPLTFHKLTQINSGEFNKKLGAIIK